MDRRRQPPQGRRRLTPSSSPSYCMSADSSLPARRRRAARTPQAGVARARTNPWAMSVSSEVKRTLVKSPPELWAELSDPNALAAISASWARSASPAPSPNVSSTGRRRARTGPESVAGSRSNRPGGAPGSRCRRVVRSLSWSLRPRPSRHRARARGARAGGGGRGRDDPGHRARADAWTRLRARGDCAGDRAGTGARPNRGRT